MLNDDNNELNYFENVYFNDWSLKLISNWVQNLLDGQFINESICEALLDDYIINVRISRSEFINRLCGQRETGKVCRNLCNYHCATAKNIRYRCLNANRRLETFLNFEVMHDDIIKDFFNKLEYETQQKVKKCGIGLLTLYLESDEDREDEFVTKERKVIINQLDSRFYIADYKMIVLRKLFKFVKDKVDGVVLILDSSYLGDTTLHDYYHVLRQFPFLKVFVVCTEDVATRMNEPSIELSVRSVLQPLIPCNKILYYDWLENPQYFLTFIKKNISFGLRVKNAIRSRFVFEK